MKSLLTILILSISVILSTEVQANIFGQDARQRWEKLPSISSPLDSVGTLRHPDGERCTASYIGKSLILTAAHCVMKHGKNQLQKGDYLFEYAGIPGGGHPESRTITRFYYVELIQLEDGGIEKAGNHWAILELDSPISSSERHFGYDYPGGDEYDEYHESNYDLSIVGFSPEFNGNTNAMTFSDANCDIQEHLLNSYIALHDCDAGPRDSGAPLYKCNVNEADTWANCYIYALHIGAFSGHGIKISDYSRENANIAVTVKSFRKAFYYLIMGGRKPYNLKSSIND